MGFFQDLKQDLSQTVNELNTDAAVSELNLDTGGMASEDLFGSDTDADFADLEAMLEKEVAALGEVPSKITAPQEESAQIEEDVFDNNMEDLQIEEGISDEEYLQEAEAEEEIAMTSDMDIDTEVENSFEQEETEEEITAEENDEEFEDQADDEEENTFEQEMQETEYVEEEAVESEENIEDSSDIDMDTDMEDSQDADIDENMEDSSDMDSSAENVSDTAVITEGMTITGDVTSSGNMNLIGNVTGNIEILGKLNVTGGITGNSSAAEIYVESAQINGELRSKGCVKVGQSSVIIGNIFATSAVIAGAVKGDIDIQGPVILDSSAIVMGNIKSKSVQINNGAIVEGMCSQCYAEIKPESFFNEVKKKH